MKRATYLVCRVAVAAVIGVGAGTTMESRPLPVPRFVVDPFWPKPAPERWVTEEVGGLCIDSKDHVFTTNRGNLLPIEKQIRTIVSPPIVEYAPDGRVVNSWGSREVLPENLHGCAFDRDDNVWVIGSGDGIAQKWTHDGSRMLLQIGKRGVCDTSSGACSGDGLNRSTTSLSRPAGIAVDATTGDVYVADGYGNHRVVVFDRNGTFKRQWGTAGAAPGQLSLPHCVVLNQGLVYVCDRSNDRIQVFDPSGTLKDVIPVTPGTGESHIGSACGMAFSPDGRYLYADDIGNSVLWIIDRATKAMVGGFGRPGHGTGELNSFHSMAVDSKGNIYTGEVTGRRIQKFVPRGVVADDKLGRFLDRPHYEPLQ